MGLLGDQAVDSAENKPMPVIEQFDGGYGMKVGSTGHLILSDALARMLAPQHI